MMGLLTGANPDDLLEVQAEILAERPLANGQPWELRDIMFYDRLARSGLAGFTFEECNDLQSIRVREQRLGDVSMTPAARERHAFMVYASKFFPVH